MRRARRCARGVGGAKRQALRWDAVVVTIVIVHCLPRSREDLDMPSRVGSTTSLGGADAVVDELAARKGQWTRISPADRIDLLRPCADRVLSVADGWVTAACRAKGIDTQVPLPWDL